MGRKRGYIRVWKGGPTEGEQRTLLAAAGVEVDGPHAPIYVDAPSPRKMQAGAAALEWRESCIKAMRERSVGDEPDELVVCAPWVLAVSASDLFSVAAKLAEKGAVIHDLNSGQRMRWTPEMAGLAAMAESVSRFQHRRRTEKARITLAATDVRTGPMPKLTGRLLDLFLKDWGDPLSGTNKEVCDRHGISPTTALKIAGNRTEAIRKASRERYDRMEPEILPPRRGRKPKLKPAE